MTDASSPATTPSVLSLPGLVAEMAVLLAPLATAAKRSQPQGLIDFARDAGVDLGGILEQLEQLRRVAERVTDAYEVLAPLTGADEVPTAADIAPLTAAVRDVIEAVKTLDELDRQPDMDAIELVQPLIDHLVVHHLRHHRRMLYWSLRLVGAIRGDQSDRPRLRPGALPGVVSDPRRVMAETYGWATEVFAARAVLTNLQHVVQQLGVPASFDVPPDAEGSSLGADTSGVASGHALSALLLTLMADDIPPALVGLRFLPLPPIGDHPTNAGLAVVPFGTSAVGSRRALSAGWEATFRASADVAARYGFVIRPGSAGLAALDEGEVPQDLRVEASLASINRPGEPTFVIGDPEGSRLEIGQMGVRATATMGDDREFVVAFPILGCRVVVDASDGDGFLQAIFAGGAARASFDLTPAWSSTHGLHLEGSADLTSTLAVHDSFGPVAIRSVRFAATPHDDDRGFATTVAVTADVGLGPVTATVEQVGFELAVGCPEDRDGRFGILDASSTFAPPKGVGVEIGAGPVTGGGYLFFDPDQQRYAGAVQLDVEGIALNAVALLTTDLPGGGYSLLVAISSDDFAPINLGLGFTLNGVGGLLGVNRIAAVDKLRAGLADHTLDAVLFPDDPVGNAEQIVSDLRDVFPPTPGRHVVGPAAVIGWGTPTVVTADLAIVLELPEPVRLVALGQLRTRLPSQDQPLVRLNMDAIGVVDFDDGRASLDATLYDSRIGDYAINGDMALRSRWKTDPAFVLAVGGLNPRFTPPPGFPTLERLSISLTSGDNTRLRLDAYLALTSNTAQIGALLDLHVSGGGFSIDGYLQFDALFVFAPFGFVVDVGGGVTVKWHDHTLAGVQLEMTLSGPAPMHARGKATFSVWRFSHSVDFDVTLGTGEPVPALPPADPLPALVDALGDVRNWSSAPPGRSAATLRDVGGADATVLAHPQGVLEVRQHVVPLDTEITRYARRLLAGGPRSFTVHASLGDGATPVRPQVVHDHFAPAQFFALTDDEKLSRPSFERLPAGLRVGSDAITTAPEDLTTTADLDYRTRIVDTRDGAAREHATYRPPAGRLEQLTRRTAANQSRAARTGRSAYRAASLGITVDEPSYVVARTDDLGVEVSATPAGAQLTYTEAAEALRHARSRRPDGAAGLQIAARHEAVGALFAPQRPGENPRQPGEYVESDPSGARIRHPRQVTIEPGDEPLPPTQEPGWTWLWVGPPQPAEARS